MGVTTTPIHSCKISCLMVNASVFYLTEDELEERLRRHRQAEENHTLTKSPAVVIMASSTSDGEITSPPLLMISFERPVTYR